MIKFQGRGLAGSVSRNVNIFMSTSDEQLRNKFEVTSTGTAEIDCVVLM